MTHLRLTRDLAGALADRSTALGVTQQEVLRRVLRLALGGHLRPAPYVAGSTYGVAPMPLQPETAALVEALVGGARNPGYELRRWLSAGLRSGDTAADDAAGGPADPRPVVRRQTAVLWPGGGPVPVGMRLDAAARCGERRAVVLAGFGEVLAAGLVAAVVFGACALAGVVGLAAFPVD